MAEGLFHDGVFGGKGTGVTAPCGFETGRDWFLDVVGLGIMGLAPEHRPLAESLSIEVSSGPGVGN